MEKEARIYVAGHNGLAGSAITRKLLKEGYNNLITKSSKELDLRDKRKVDEFFETEEPQYVFFAAGTVGGIMANKTFPADFVYNNVSMILNTIEAAYKYKVSKLLYLGSSCIYPRDAPQPIKEEYLLTSKLEETNKPYALAKIVGIELCISFNRQFQTNNICLMPTNLFGINDNYDAHNSHLVAALIRKFHEAKMNNLASVELWGTGSPRREVLSSDQLADACLYYMLNYSGDDIINVGSGNDLTISEIAGIIKEISGFNGEIHYNTNKPDGTMKKQLDVSFSEKLGWKAKSDLIRDLQTTYDDFSTNYVKYTSSN